MSALASVLIWIFASVVTAIVVGCILAIWYLEVTDEMKAAPKRWQKRRYGK